MNNSITLVLKYESGDVVIVHDVKISKGAALFELAVARGHLDIGGHNVISAISAQRLALDPSTRNTGCRQLESAQADCALV